MILMYITSILIKIHVLRVIFVRNSFINNIFTRFNITRDSNKGPHAYCTRHALIANKIEEVQHRSRIDLAPQTTSKRSRNGANTTEGPQPAPKHTQHYPTLGHTTIGHRHTPPSHITNTKRSQHNHIRPQIISK